MTVQVFDDGSTLTYDAAGNVLAATDFNGNPYPVAGASGSGIVQQFANLFAFGLGRYIDHRYPRQPAPPPPLFSTGGGVNLGALVPVIVLGGIAIFAYKALKG